MDAAEDVIVDYDPKPAVVDPETALEDGSPLVWEEFGTNKTHEWAVGGGDIDAAFAEADVTVEHRFVTTARRARRSSRAARSRSPAATTSPSGRPRRSRTSRASFSPGCSASPEDKLRVVAPDVGGGFGAKLQVYGEEALVLALAKRLGRPVKWVETRSEHMTTSHHGRDQINYVKLGAKRDGTVTGVPGADHRRPRRLPAAAHAVHSGAGLSGDGRLLPVPGDRPALQGVFTNKFCTDAIRGAGRPEATYWIELMMDKLAGELGMDPLELRRKNFIPKEEFPFTTALGITYDSGDYHGTLDKLLEHFDLDGFRQEQAEPAREGHLPRRGLLDLRGGVRPRALAGGRPAGRGPTGRLLGVRDVRVTPSGSATVFTGTSPHGQGHDTSFAQIAADRLGIDPQNVDVSTATPTRDRGAGTRTARARWRSAARRSRARPRRCRTRRSGSARRCSRRRRRTSSWPAASSRFAARPTSR